MSAWMSSLVIAILLLSSIFLMWLFLVKMTRSIRNELAQVTSHVGIHLEQTARLAQHAGDGAAKIMGDVYTRLGALEESSRKIYEIGNEIGKLQEVLRAPKARGNFGEFILADVLGQIIPMDHFQLQYSFRNGSRVDAVIFVGNYLVPVDAKFPLDNFQRLVAIQAPEERKKVRREFVRDVKRHIDAITERYISPSEGTLDFALMYIPAENVYYEVIASADDADTETLSSYALGQHVIPVSPNSFYAYLQVILLGLRGLKMDQAAREIVESLTKMQSDFKRIVEDLGVLGSHLNHAKGTYEKVLRGADQFQLKLTLVDEVKLPVNEKEPLKPTELSK